MTLSDRQQLLSQVFFFVSRVIQQRGDEKMSVHKLRTTFFFSRFSPEHWEWWECVLKILWARHDENLLHLFNLIIYNDIFARDAQLVGWEMFRFMKMSFRFPLNDGSFSSSMESCMELITEYAVIRHTDSCALTCRMKFDKRNKRCSCTTQLTNRIHTISRESKKKKDLSTFPLVKVNKKRTRLIVSSNKIWHSF